MNLDITKLPAGGIFVITGKNGSGKSRLLERFAKDFLRNDAEKSRLICLSGAISDRFPERLISPRYMYLGRRVNNNFISELQPYKILIKQIIRRNRSDYLHRERVAANALRELQMDSNLQLSFRPRRRRDGRVDMPLQNPQIHLTLGHQESDNTTILDLSSSLERELVELSGFAISKQSKIVDISELSSGERIYTLSLLVAAFCIEDGSTVLFDEPENSLHPQWQASIIKNVWSVMNSVAKRPRLIIATHSPLVLSSTPNVATFVADLENGGTWTKSTLQGNSSDVVLKQQFNLRSPRSMSFLKMIQDCINTMVDAEKNPEPFKKSVEVLQQSHVRLDPDDPLYKTVEGIVSYRRKI
jgi:predicted ATPase